MAQPTSPRYSRRQLLLMAAALVLLIAVFTWSQAQNRTPPRGFVTQAQYGEQWPLTVADGLLRCDNGRRVTFQTNGLKYAVNGTAKDTYPPIDPIWKDDPSVSGAKISIGPLIDAGLALCS